MEKESYLEAKIGEGISLEAMKMEGISLKL